MDTTAIANPACGLETALADLAPTASPRGTIRVAGFASAIRRSVLPALSRLAAHAPEVDVTVAELEPDAALARLAAAEADIALVFDYSLHPWQPDPALVVRPMWTAPWGLITPADAGGPDPSPIALLDRNSWVVDSRSGADEMALRVLTAGADRPTRVLHRADDLALLHDLVAAGLGVGLHPLDRATSSAVTARHLPAPGLTLRAWAAVRRGQDTWPPIAAVVAALGRF